MNSLKLIEQLSNAYGACGFEDQVVEIAEKFAQDEALGSVRHDCNLNVYITPEKNAGKKPVVMVDAHSDEVSFIVQAIKPNGTLQFLPLGGWSNYTVPAHKVKVQTYDGRWVSGIVASTPVHFLSAAQKQMDQLDGASDQCEGENYVLEGTRKDILENKCALVVKEGQLFQM